MRLNRTLLLIATALFSLASGAQTPADIGLQTYHEYQGGDIDQVNLDTSNLSLSIPLVSYPQRGSALKVDYALSYNGSSMSFKLTCQQLQKGRICIGAWGWHDPIVGTKGGPALVDKQDLGSRLNNFTTNIPDINSTGNFSYDQYGWMTADGGYHAAVQTNTGQMSYDGTNIQAGFKWSPFLDNAIQVCTWYCPTTWGESFGEPMGTRDGITYFESSQTGTGPVRVDADGNYISASSGGIIDTMGRTIAPPSPRTAPTTAQLASCTGPLTVTSVSTWSPPGYNTPFLFCYATLSLTFPHFINDVASPTTFSDPVLQSVVLPNGQAWTFEYNEALTGCANSAGYTLNFGDVTQVTFPTGGSLSYTYGCLQSAGSILAGAVESRSLDAADGRGPHTWTYSHALNGATKLTTVTDPLGNATVSSFTAGEWTGGINATRVTQTYSGNATTGVLLRTNTKSFPAQYATPMGFPILPTSETVTLESGQSTVTTYQYCCDVPYDSTTPLSQDQILTGVVPYATSYGKVTDTKVYDYSTSGQGTLLKDTVTSYQFQNNAGYIDPGFFDLIASQTVYDGGGIQVAQTSYGYDETARVVSGIASLPNSQMETPPFGIFGHLTSQTSWLNTGSSNPKTTISYYDTGAAYKTTDPLGHATTAYYCTGASPTTIPCTASDYLGALPTVVTNALNQQANFTYRPDTGQTLSVTDPNGQATTNTYNDSMNRLTGVVFPDQGETDIQYNDTGTIGVTVIEHITPASATTISAPPCPCIVQYNPGVFKATQSNIDGLGRDVETILQSDPSGPSYTRTSYDAMGRKHQVWNPTRCDPMTATSCPAESTWGYSTYEYDALGRPTLLIPPDGSATANNEKTTYSGNTTTVIDEAGAKRTTTVDALGRLTQVSEGAAGYVTAYTYDALGNMTCVEQHGGVTGTGCSSSSASDATSPWRVRRLTYDSLSRLMTTTSPETGKVTFGYNLDGVLTSKTDARGITITSTPDVLHRITQKTYSDAEPTVTYSYDAHSTTNFGVGRRTGMKDSSGATAWTYDQMGRKWSEAKTIGSVTKSTSTVYNLDGSVSQVTYPAESTIAGAPSVVISLTPGPAGLPLAVHDINNGVNYALSLVYTPIGQVATALYGASATYAGISQVNSYNKRGQPIRLQACGLSACTDGAASTTPYLLDLSYNFGLGVTDNGNVQAITNNKDTSRSQSFTYDSLNRVLTARTASSWGVSFTNSANGAPGIDAWGNLIQTSAISGTSGNPMPMSQQVNLKNQLALNGFTYDAAGNVLTDGVNSGCGTNAYSWNAEEQMACGAGSTYSYDGDGMRVKKTGGSSTSTAYWGITSGAGPLAESDLSGNITSEYIYLNGRRIARRDVSTGAIYYYFSDQLGSSNVIASSAGKLVNESDFYPFGGERAVAVGLSSQHYKFTGKERDSETGLDHFDFRSLGGITGRWMSPDAVFGSIYNPQTLNRYAYVNNNPLRLIDPLGLCDQDPTNNPQIKPGETWCDVVTPKGSTGPFLCGCIAGSQGGGGVGGHGGGGQGGQNGAGSSADGMSDNPMAQALFHGQGKPYWGAANKMVEYATLGTAGAYALAGTVVAGIVAAPAIAELAVHLAARGAGWYLGLTGSGTGVVLGQFNEFTNYLTAAQSIGANALSVPMRVYYFFDAAGEWWTLNEAFMDASIFRGQEFMMSSPVLGATGNYALELQYLTMRGIDASQWVMVRLPY